MLGTSKKVSSKEAISRMNLAVRALPVQGEDSKDFLRIDRISATSMIPVGHFVTFRIVECDGTGQVSGLNLESSTHQSGEIFGLWVAHNLLRRSCLNQITVLHYNQPVAQSSNDLEIMANEEIAEPVVSLHTTE
jgi:hypothetical protein